jgi:hypothetical protein
MVADGVRWCLDLGGAETACVGVCGPFSAFSFRSRVTWSRFVTYVSVLAVSLTGDSQFFSVEEDDEPTPALAPEYV